MKKIAVLGSTGSIGKNTLQIASHLNYRIEALSAHSNIELLAQQIKQYQPSIVAVCNQDKGILLQKQFPHLNVVIGPEAQNEVVCWDAVDFVVIALVGIEALGPTIQAIQQKKPIGLANKEVLVSAGELICSLARRHNVPLIPIDSEHSGIFQCLEKRNLDDIRRVILTASGGPFRNLAKEQLAKVTVNDALKHPTWKMGSKITIDSSTLMNKGLEMIEARWLFNLAPEKIEVIIHPQSIIHCLIEWMDGSIFAQMSEPDMRLPIQYALTYPERKQGMLPSFDFEKNHVLEFSKPDTDKFPAIDLAKAAMQQKSSFACYLNAANEVLVDRFLKREISWTEIIFLLEKLMNRHISTSLNSIDEVVEIDRMARSEALR